MDHRESKKDGHDSDRHHPVDQFPLSTISSPQISSSGESSLDGQPSKLLAHVDSSTSPDMDSAGDARRRKALLMKHANGSIADSLQAQSNPRRQRRKATDGSRDLSGRNRTTHSSDDGESSDFSSRTTSEDVELKSMSSDLDFTEDEEAGLAKKDRGRRKRRRRRNTLLKDRVVGVPSVSKQEHDSADRSVVRALLINASLIASWYAFSLSISIVSLRAPLAISAAVNAAFSITSGCFRRSFLTLVFLFSPPACICWSNLHWLALSSISYHDFAQRQTASPIPTAIPTSGETQLNLTNLS